MVGPLAGVEVRALAEQLSRALAEDRPVFAALPAKLLLVDGGGTAFRLSARCRHRVVRHGWPPSRCASTGAGWAAAR